MIQSPDTNNVATATWLTCVGEASVYEMNSSTPTVSPVPMRITPESQLAQNGRNSVQLRGLWYVWARLAPDCCLRMTDRVLAHPPRNKNNKEAYSCCLSISCKTLFS